jgi:uncharacterized protein (DUF305 family)
MFPPDRSAGGIVDPPPRSSARWRALMLAPALATSPLAAAAAGDAVPFLAENGAAMSRMMTDMAIKATGDVDRDFVAMVAPHHQGAVDVAEVYLRYGHNQQLRRLAQEIIVT